MTAMLLGHAAVVLIFGLPLWWMVVSSLQPREEIFAHMSPLSWEAFFPTSASLANFGELFSSPYFGRSVANSVVISVVTVGLAVLVNAAAAFVLARIRIPGRQILFVLILSTMLVPFEALMVSMSLVVRRLGIFDTYAALILPWVADAFIIFLLRQHFRELPQELHDAATVDGCSPFRMFWKVMLPNIKPALVSAAFVKFLLSWDAYIWPLIVITDREKEVVNVSIARLFTSEQIQWHLVFAGSVVATVPIVILFMLLQRYYTEGVATTGIRG